MWVCGIYRLLVPNRPRRKPAQGQGSCRDVFARLPQEIRDAPRKTFATKPTRKRNTARHSSTRRVVFHRETSPAALVSARIKVRRECVWAAGGPCDPSGAGLRVELRKFTRARATRSPPEPPRWTLRQLEPDARRPRAAVASNLPRHVRDSTLGREVGVLCLRRGRA